VYIKYFVKFVFNIMPSLLPQCSVVLTFRPKNLGPCTCCLSYPYCPALLENFAFLYDDLIALWLSLVCEFHNWISNDLTSKYFLPPKATDDIVFFCRRTWARVSLSVYVVTNVSWCPFGPSYASSLEGLVFRCRRSRTEQTYGNTKQFRRSMRARG
jgi:hypothetical protein